MNIISSYGREKCFYNILVLNLLNIVNICGSCLIERYSNESNGFHRVINTVITFAADANVSNVLMLEKLTSSFYVDVYQIASLFESNKQKVYVPEAIDLEQPESLSQSFNVWLYNESYKEEHYQRVTFNMPLHIRYHMPHNDEPYKKIDLPLPSLYVPALDDSSDVIQYPCYQDFAINCSWSPINCTMVSDDVYFYIPIGMSQHHTIVFIVTNLTVILSVMLLVYGLTRKNVKNKDE